MTNFKTTQIAQLAQIAEFYDNGKVFLHDLLNLTSCEISINSMPKGVKLPFNHKHKQNEEVYIFLKGSAIMTLDNEKVEIKEGTCIKVSPQAKRTIESIEDLQYICIQAKADSLEQFGLDDAELI